jgi:hypothetical protein
MSRKEFHKEIEKGINLFTATCSIPVRAYAKNRNLIILLFLPKFAIIIPSTFQKFEVKDTKT